jgi:hypothetical protein
MFSMLPFYMCLKFYQEVKACLILPCFTLIEHTGLAEVTMKTMQNLVLTKNSTFPTFIFISNHVCISLDQEKAQ